MPDEKLSKHPSEDARLTYVPAHYKKLVQQLSDAEWEGDPSADFIRTEVAHFKALLDQGVLYEPNF